MKKPNSYKVVLSSIFFILFVITALALILSTFKRNFSQLFLIFNEPGHFYAALVSILYVCGILMSLGYFVLSARHRSPLLIPKLVALVGCVLFFYLCLLDHKRAPTNMSLQAFLLSLFFYLAFVLGLWRFYARWQPHHSLLKYLILFAPSMNVCLITLFASSFQSYFLKNDWHAWVDFLLFGLGLAFLIVVLAKRKECFGLYEYANLLVLVAGIAVFILSSPVIWQVDRYNDARWTFYLLGFLGWYGEWMYLSLKQNGAVL